MPELYDIFDANEIDGQDRDTDIIALDEHTEWTKVLSSSGEDLPEGNYDFAISFQATLSETNKSIEYRVAGSVTLDAEELHVDKVQPIVRHTYWFNLSWDGGIFNVDIEMSRKNDTFTAVCDFAEFSVTRRS
jgi:hypothetical protein